MANAPAPRPENKTSTDHFEHIKKLKQATEQMRRGRPLALNGDIKKRLEATLSQSDLTSQFNANAMQQMHPNKSYNDLTSNEKMDVAQTTQSNLKAVAQLSMNNKLTPSLLERMLANVNKASNVFNNMQRRAAERNYQKQMQRQQQAQTQNSNNPQNIDLTSRDAILFDQQVGGMSLSTQRMENQNTAIQESINLQLAEENNEEIAVEQLVTELNEETNNEQHTHIAEPKPEHRPLDEDELGIAESASHEPEADKLVEKLMKDSEKEAHEFLEEREAQKSESITALRNRPEPS